MPYVAMINQSGYMPDQEPELFETYNEAKKYLLQELKRLYDEDESFQAEQHASACRDIEQHGFTYLSCDMMRGQWYFGINKV